LYLSSVPIDT